MSDFISEFAPDLEAMLDYREALGFSRLSHRSSLIAFDRFCGERYPDSKTLTKEMTHQWLETHLEKKHSNIQEKATAVRLFGKYLEAIGKDAYILPTKFATERKTPEPYIFMDAELRALFTSADTFPEWRDEPFLPEIVPVLLRLIYTCGLRPNEGRELMRRNINFSSGEILITKTKKKKDRVIVMSDDMLASCKQYDLRRGIFAADSDYFFPAHNGRSFSAGQLDRIMKQCWERANPETDAAALPMVRTYDLRHRFASSVLNRWLDQKRNLYNMLPYLRAYMGHDKLSETAYYIHILPENLIKSAGIDWDAFDAVIPEVSEWQG